MDSRKLQELQEEYRNLGKARNSLFAPLQKLPAQIEHLEQLAKTCQNSQQQKEILSEVSDLKRELLQHKTPENLKMIEEFDRRLEEIRNQIIALQIKHHGFSDPDSPSFLNSSLKNG